MHTQTRHREHQIELPPPVETAILEAIRTLDYGSVEITVHDGRVVQIECKKKIRFHAQTEAAKP